MYLLAFLDRVNIANAKLLGLAEDLNLGSGDKYNTALVIFFIPYVIFEMPFNVVMKKVKPHVWLSVNMFLFGFLTIMQGLVKNYSGLLAVRFFLGLCETSMFPGSFYLIGMWYKRKEGQKRYSFFFSSTTLAGAFGGLLAAAIGKMDHLHGYRGWRWIFIIEGGITVFFSFILFFLLPDFPEEVKWLKEDERAFVAARLRADQGTGSGHEATVTAHHFFAIFKDLKMVLGGFMYLGLIVPAYGYAYFAPTIVSTFHYSPIESQLRSVPPWAASFVFSLMCAYLSDRLRHRFLFAVMCMLITIAGFIILLVVHDNRNVEYGALFLIAGGCYSAMPIVVCWYNMNIGGHIRRALGSAWQVAFGNLGGIIAVYLFLTKDAPRFTVGYSVGLAFTGLSVVSSTIYALACLKTNKDRDAAADAPLLSEEEKQELGDSAPTYRYLL
ncbi:putative transporter [Escovopsis weberi]|uniref:Putative transporter n=1 Tax=Escovopsis weberi TaxID=150374 RepID=A0A0M8N148_ESCWE|nr:putative transporter [Escovopsis weberi]